MTHERRITKLVPTRLHFACIMAPFTFKNDDHEVTKYGIRLPAEQFPEVMARDRGDEFGPTVHASSKFQPVIVPGEGEGEDWNNWERLLELAARWNYPADRLLVDREIEVSTVLWTSNRPSRYVIGTGTYVSLEAVKIGGDLTKDEGLEAHIKDTKAFFTGEVE